MDEKLFREKCRGNGIKVTPQRLAVYRELSGSKEHPTADKLFRRIRRRFPEISFDTVNRTVLMLAAIGLIREVEGGMGRRFDPNIGSHHHLKCLKCRSISDFHNKVYDELRLPQKLPAGFTVLNKQVVLEGLCGKCKP